MDTGTIVATVILPMVSKGGQKSNRRIFKETHPKLLEISDARLVGWTNRLTILVKMLPNETANIMFVEIVPWSEHIFNTSRCTLAITNGNLTTRVIVARRTRR
jgi:hypothetical protein